MAIMHTFTARVGTETRSLTALKAIRQKCLECSDFSFAEVKNCTLVECALFPFRFGKGVLPTFGKAKNNPAWAHVFKKKKT